VGFGPARARAVARASGGGSSSEWSEGDRFGSRGRSLRPAGAGGQIPPSPPKTRRSGFLHFFFFFLLHIPFVKHSNHLASQTYSVVFCTFRDFSATMPCSCRNFVFIYFRHIISINITEIS